MHCPVAIAQIVCKPSSLDNAPIWQKVSTYLDAQAQWPDISKTSPDGLVLVRPDGHVLWRCYSLASLVGQSTGQHADAVLQCAKVNLSQALHMCLGN